jgi:hypothetical protein
MISIVHRFLITDQADGENTYKFDVKVSVYKPMLFPHSLVFDYR